MEKLYVKPGEYEQKVQEARDMIEKIESGRVNLSDSIQDYRKIALVVNNLENTLKHFNKTIAKVETDDNQEVPYSRDKNGKDVQNNVNIPNQSQSTKQNNSLHHNSQILKSHGQESLFGNNENQ